MTEMSKQPYTHLLRFEPLGSFFFGDESVNAEDGSMFYFQQSRHYPQQTTLLGTLRYQLLKQNGAFEAHRERIKKGYDAKALIGEASFDAFTANQSFGVIEQLSPVFVLNAVNQPLFECFTVANKTLVLAQSPNWTTDVVFKEEKITWQNQAMVKAYDPKQGFSEGYIDKCLKVHSSSDIYTYLNEKIGINKPKEDEAHNNEGFFKLQYRRFQKGYAFGCYITLKEGSILQDTYITMGKERSLFKMTVTTPVASFEEQIPPLPHLSGGIWLLSDTFTSPGILDKCSFVINDVVSFRNIQTTIHTKNHYGRPRTYQEPDTTEEDRQARKNPEIAIWKPDIVFNYSNEGASCSLRLT
jgi:CRISPR-associated protein Cmr3